MLGQQWQLADRLKKRDVQAYQHSIVHASILPKPLQWWRQNWLWLCKSTFVNSIYSLGQAIILP